MTIKGYLFFSRPNPTDEVPDPEWEILNEVPEPAENFLIEGLDSNTDFEFAAKAVDLAGNESEMSEPLDVSTLTYTHNDDPLDEEDQLAIVMVFIKVPITIGELDQTLNFLQQPPYYNVFRMVF